MRLHDQVTELKLINADAIELLNDFRRLLALPKFANTDADRNDWIAVSDVRAQLELIGSCLTRIDYMK